MKSVILYLLLFPALLLAQSESHLRIKEEIAKHPRGSWLYARSEVFRKLVSRKVNSDTPPIDGLQMQQASGGSYKNISNDINTGQDETSVAISRKDQNVIVIGSNDEQMDVSSMPVYISTNAGASWDTYRLPKVPESYIPLGDPILLADNSGGFYYAHLIYQDGSGRSNLLVNRSSDGKSWTYDTPVLTGTNHDGSTDRESMAIDRDPASPYYNRVYISWMHFGESDETFGVYLSSSDDSTRTWSKPVRVRQGYLYAANVQVGKAGRVFITGSEYSETDDTTYHYFYSSADGGKTFSEKTLAPFFNYPFYLGAGLTQIKGQDGVRAIPNIVYNIDNLTGTMHLVYGSYGYIKQFPDLRSAQLNYISSSDNGENWTDAITIGGESDGSLLFDRFMPSLACDDLTGKPYLFYLSSENDTKNVLYQPYLLRLGTSQKGIALSDSSANPFLIKNTSGDPFIGDYTGLDVHNNTFCAAWTENADLGIKGEIYAFISTNIDSVKSAITQTKISSNGLSIYPNPGSAKRTITFDLKHTGDVSIKLFDSEGKFVASVLDEYLSTGEHSKEVLLPSLASGMYSLVLTDGDSRVSKNIIISK